MFRKRHVQIGPVILTMAHGDALSFYVKGGHVPGVLWSHASRTRLILTLLKSGACGG